MVWGNAHSADADEVVGFQHTSRIQVRFPGALDGFVSGHLCFPYLFRSGSAHETGDLEISLDGWNGVCVGCEKTRDLFMGLFGGRACEPPMVGSSVGNGRDGRSGLTGSLRKDWEVSKPGKLRVRIGHYE